MTSTVAALAILLSSSLPLEPALAKSDADSSNNSPRPLTLWEVRSEGKAPSYLFGTCHIGVTLDEALPKEHRTLISESSRFVMEIDPSEIDPVAFQMRFLLPTGTTLGTLIGKERWAVVAETLKLGAAREAFEQQHPFALLMYVLSTMVQGLNTGAPPMDLAVREIAIDGDVEKIYLETPDEQIEIFLGIPVEEWAKGIAELDDPEKLDELKASLDAVLNFCRAGDASGFEEIRKKMKGDSVSLELDARVFKLRNQAWLPKLEASFAEGSTFVSVGAGHMTGEDGLVKLLENRGYTVRQLHGTTEVAPTLAEAKPLEEIPRSLFLEQVSLVVSNLLCHDNGVALQCTQATKSACREIATVAVEQCALRQNTPATIAVAEAVSTSASLGQCAGTDFWSLIPPPTQEDRESEGCKAALSKLPQPEQTAPGTP